MVLMLLWILDLLGLEVVVKCLFLSSSLLNELFFSSRL